MRIDYYHNKKNGNTYVYQAESYYDPAKKRCGTRRKLIGKLDENGEVIPTGKRGRPQKQSSTDAENGANPALNITAVLAYPQRKQRKGTILPCCMPRWHASKSRTWSCGASLILLQKPYPDTALSKVADNKMPRPS